MLPVTHAAAVQPEWYVQQQKAAENPPPDEGVRVPLAPQGSQAGVGNILADGLWNTPWVSAEKHPHPRFEHGSCMLGNCLFILGGNCGAVLPAMWCPRGLIPCIMLQGSGAFALVNDNVMLLGACHAAALRLVMPAVAQAVGASESALHHCRLTPRVGGNSNVSLGQACL